MRKKLACIYFHFFGNFKSVIAQMKNKGFKRLVRKWINNTFTSNSVQYHMLHRKNLSFLYSFGLGVVFVKGS